ncbi:hypothetical protein BJ741DRAFT_604482 [Chytriomyces cf. hyalinus JEL632]|nr:hypothetical protein BJ741DRAFT_604482 [Chytriomyces cf. hyalinus JEL632]
MKTYRSWRGCLQPWFLWVLVPPAAEDWDKWEQTVELVRAASGRGGPCHSDPKNFAKKRWLARFPRLDIRATGFVDPSSLFGRVTATCASAADAILFIVWWQFDLVYCLLVLSKFKTAWEPGRQRIGIYIELLLKVFWLLRCGNPMRK